MSKRWDRQWNVPSSKGDKTYKVSVKEGTHTGVDEWACSCPHWKYRLNGTGGVCKHIQRVLDGDFDEITESKPPIVVLANVAEVHTTECRHCGGKSLMVPLVPIGNTHMLATLCYDQSKAGIPWSELKKKYRLKNWTKVAVYAYIQDHGRMVYNKFERGLGWHDLIVVPLEGEE